MIKKLNKIWIAGLAFMLLSCTGQVTEQTAGRPQGGIGGTGSPVDFVEGTMGLFGQITGFGSILINGLSITVPQDLEQMQLKTGHAPLTAGSTVLIEAQVDQNSLTAYSIKEFHPLRGTIEKIEEERIRVLGTWVLLADDVPVFDKNGRPAERAALKPGQDVAVSGIWQKQHVQATRLDLLGKDESGDVIRGLLLPDGDHYSLGAIQVRFSDSLERAPGFMALRGHWRQDVFEAAQDLNETLFGDDIGYLSVEGAIALDPDGQGYHLSGFGIALDDSAPLVSQPGRIGIFEGPFDGALRIIHERR